jgi:PKD repeat protein
MKSILSRKYKSILIGVACLLFLFKIAGAAHVTGGSIHWKTVANGDSLIVEVITYAECNGTVYNDGYITISTAKKSATLFNLKVKSTRKIDNICSTACSPCGTGSCSNKVGFQEIIYYKKFYLPIYIDTANCELNITYNDCCRPLNFTTADSKNKSLKLEAYLNFCNSSQDQSPVLNDSLIQSINLARYQLLDFSMQDQDADSIKYYVDSVHNVSWKKGFNSEYPFFGGYELDSITGIVQLRSRRIEISALAVQTVSFKNGKVKCATTREYPYFVQKNEVVRWLEDSLGTYSKNVIAVVGDTFNFKWWSRDYLNTDSKIDTHKLWRSRNNRISLNFRPTQNQIGKYPLIFKINNNKCPYFNEDTYPVYLHIMDSTDQSFKIKQENYNDECGQYKFLVPEKFEDYWSNTKWYLNGKHYATGYQIFPKLERDDTTIIKVTVEIGSHSFSDSIVFIPSKSPKKLLSLDSLGSSILCADSFEHTIKAQGGVKPYKFRSHDRATNTYGWDSLIKVDLSRVSTTNNYFSYSVIDAKGCAISHGFTYNTKKVQSLDILPDSTICDSGNYDFRLPLPYSSGIWTGNLVSDTNYFEGSKTGFQTKSYVYYKNLDPKYCLADMALIKLRKRSRIKFKTDTAACINNNDILLFANPPGGAFSGIGVTTIDSVNYFFGNFSNAGKRWFYYNQTNKYGCSTIDSHYISVKKDTLQFPNINKLWCQGSDSISWLKTVTKYDKWAGYGVFFNLDSGKYYLNWNSSLPEKLILNFETSRDYGCYANGKFEIDIVEKPNISFIHDSIVCAMTETYLRATPNIGSWNHNNIASAYFKYPGNPLSDTTFNLKYEVTDFNKCSFTYSTQIVVRPLATFKLPKYTDTICAKEKRYRLPIPNIYDTFYWEGKNVVNTNNEFKITFIESLRTGKSHNYDLYVDQNEKCANTESFSLFIKPKVVGDFEASKTEGKAPHAVTFTATEDSATNYIWLVNSNIYDTTNANQITIEFDSAGVYDIGLKVTNGYCTDSVNLKNLVSILPNSAHFPSKSYIKIYPNPANDIIFISSNAFVEEIQVFTLDGRFVFSETLDANHQSFNVKNLETGMYLLILKNKGGTESFKIFAKEQNLR